MWLRKRKWDYEHLKSLDLLLKTTFKNLVLNLWRKWYCHKNKISVVLIRKSYGDQNFFDLKSSFKLSPWIRSGSACFHEAKKYVLMEGLLSYITSTYSNNSFKIHFHLFIYDSMRLISVLYAEMKGSLIEKKVPPPCWKLSVITPPYTSWGKFHSFCRWLRKTILRNISGPYIELFPVRLLHGKSAKGGFSEKCPPPHLQGGTSKKLYP